MNEPIALEHPAADSDSKRRVRDKRVRFRLLKFKPKSGPKLQPVLQNAVVDLSLIYDRLGEERFRRLSRAIASLARSYTLHEETARR
jgi:hypothetical protein